MDPLTHIYDKGHAETLCGLPNSTARLTYGFVYSTEDSLRIRDPFWGDRKTKMLENSVGEWIVVFRDGKRWFTLCPECYGIHVLVST